MAKKILKNNKERTKANVFEHSQAKLDFYQNYLWRYLTVLLNDPYTVRINIYDIFCGIGVYEDGGIGSPIIAMEAIKNLKSNFPEKKITLTINDIDKEKVDNVQSYSNMNFQNICDVDCYNHDASLMFDIVIKKLKASKSNEKNLVFIDPYGYKEIYQKNLLDIMRAGKSEIILFLPISNMYRFTKDAIEKEENKSYMHLRRFVDEFFDEKHPIKEGNFEHQLEYIDFIKDALSFDEEYFSASYHIQRDTKNYYALFFVTSNLYGLEKAVETKWKLDTLCGEGFEKSKEATLFDDLENEDKQDNCLLKLKNALVEYLREYRTNCDLYEYIIRDGFMPKQANIVLEELRVKLVFEANYKPRKKSFLLSYDSTFAPKSKQFLSGTA